MDWGEQYAAAWNAHDVEALVALTAPDCRYTDVAFRTTSEGHEGIRQMFQATIEFHPDVEVIRHSGLGVDPVGNGRRSVGQVQGNLCRNTG
jgi:hypothetical protein